MWRQRQPQDHHHHVLLRRRRSIAIDGVKPASLPLLPLCSSKAPRPRGMGTPLLPLLRMESAPCPLPSLCPHPADSTTGAAVHTTPASTTWRMPSVRPRSVSRCRLTTTTFSALPQLGATSTSSPCPCPTRRMARMKKEEEEEKGWAIPTIIARSPPPSRPPPPP